ncbi:MAG TPA: hypothetical protein VFF03_06620 [Rhodocyclaceae bacterium]|nr:hypothetical protein [Rhodocyclaceae bacterium]
MALFLVFETGAAFAQTQDINAALVAIRNEAAKVDSAAGAEREAAKQALLRSVGRAVAKAKNAEEISAILTAALTAAPAEAVAITRVAVAAAPAHAVEIAVIALNGVTDQGQRTAIVNTAVATFNASRRDAETSATLQSLLTQAPGTLQVKSQTQQVDPVPTNVPNHQPPSTPAPTGNGSVSPS